MDSVSPALLLYLNNHMGGTAVDPYTLLSTRTRKHDNDHNESESKAPLPKKRKTLQSSIPSPPSQLVAWECNNSNLVVSMMMNDQVPALLQKKISSPITKTQQSDVGLTLLHFAHNNQYNIPLLQVVTNLYNSLWMVLAMDVHIHSHKESEFYYWSKGEVQITTFYSSANNIEETQWESFFHHCWNAVCKIAEIKFPEVGVNKNKQFSAIGNKWLQSWLSSSLVSWTVMKKINVIYQNLLALLYFAFVNIQQDECAQVMALFVRSAWTSSSEWTGRCIAQKNRAKINTPNQRVDLSKFGYKSDSYSSSSSSRSSSNNNNHPK